LTFTFRVKKSASDILAWKIEAAEP